MITSLFTRNLTLVRPLPLHIGTVGQFNNIVEFSGAAPGTANWPAANQAAYVPMHMPSGFTIARFMVCNGNTATGNLDIGLYDANGTRLLSTGTTARANASLVQYIGVTDQAFPAGHYYLGLVISNNTGNVFRVAIRDQYALRMCGALQETLGSTVLPTSMTPASYTNANAFLFGFTQSDTL